MTTPAPDAALSFLIHASAKAGKSTLTSTAPFPSCILDAEGSWRFIDQSGFGSGIPLRKTHWDPLQGPPPRYDGTWDVCMVKVTRWDHLATAKQWLQTSEHDFRSVVLDSISEAQRRLKANIKPDSILDDFRQWGELLARMDDLIRGLRDLVDIPGSPLRCAVFVSETAEKSGKWRPSMQGQIATQLPYWVDVVGYLYVDKVAAEDGTTTRDVRKLLIGPHPSFETGERVQGKLAPLIEEPRIDTMLATVFPEYAQLMAKAKKEEVTTS